MYAHQFPFCDVPALPKSLNAPSKTLLQDHALNGLPCVPTMTTDTSIFTLPPTCSCDALSTCAQRTPWQLQRRCRLPPGPEL
jgi:hypothetical protein